MKELKVTKETIVKVNNLGFKCKDCGKIFVIKDLLKDLGSSKGIIPSFNTLPGMSHIHINCDCSCKSINSMMIDIQAYDTDGFDLVYTE